MRSQRETHLEELINEGRRLGLLLNFLFFLEKLENMGTLLPEVDGLLELHLALSMKKVDCGKVANKTVTLELLTKFGSHQGSRV